MKKCIGVITLVGLLVLASGAQAKPIKCLKTGGCEAKPIKCLKTGGCEAKPIKCLKTGGCEAKPIPTQTAKKSRQKEIPRPPPTLLKHSKSKNQWHVTLFTIISHQQKPELGVKSNALLNRRQQWRKNNLLLHSDQSGSWWITMWPQELSKDTPLVREPAS